MQASIWCKNCSSCTADVLNYWSEREAQWRRQGQQRTPEAATHSSTHHTLYGTKSYVSKHNTEKDLAQAVEEGVILGGVAEGRAEEAAQGVHDAHGEEWGEGARAQAPHERAGVPRGEEERALGLLAAAPPLGQGAPLQRLLVHLRGTPRGDQREDEPCAPRAATTKGKGTS